MKVLLAFTLIFLAACESKKPKNNSNSSFSCPSSESFVDNYFTYNQNANEKIAIRFQRDWIVNGNPLTLYVNRVRLFLSSDNLTQVQLDLYDSPENGPPDGGTLLATSIVNTGLGSSDPLTPVNFDFSPDMEISTDGTFYWLVLTPTGGTYQVMVTNNSIIAGSHIATHDGSWTYGAEYNSHLSMDFTYSTCTGWR